MTNIHAGAIRLHEIVDNLLDVTRLDSQTLELYPEPVSILELLQEICQKFSQQLLERNLTLTIAPLDHLPTISADLDALSKVFYQIIVNAIKYTPDGGRIIINGQALDQYDGVPVPSVKLIISDTGIGIDPRFHRLIFTKFYQTGELTLHSSGKTKFKGGGPGLGLAIAMGIIKAHQGKLWVESSGYDEILYPGSDFHILLPVSQNAEPGWGDSPGAS